MAKKNKVQLIGQVTGANGKLLQQAIDLIQNSFVSRKYNYVDFSTIEKDGLSKKSIGKIINF